MIAKRNEVREYNKYGKGRKTPKLELPAIIEIKYMYG